jgi:hypothetical protein
MGKFFKYFICVLSSAFVIQSYCYADVKSDLEKVSKNFIGESELRLKIKYAYFTSHTEVKANETEEGIYVRSKDAVYFKYQSGESLRKKEMSILVDHKNKVVNYVKSKQEKTSEATIEENIKKLSKNLERFKDIRALKGEKGVKGYEFIPIKKSDQVEKTVVYFNEKTFRIIRFVIYYRYEQEDLASPKKILKTPRLEINYDYESLVKEGDLFKRTTESWYVLKSWGKVEVSENYKAYKLVTHT